MLDRSQFRGLDSGGGESLSHRTRERGPTGRRGPAIDRSSM